MLNFDNNIDEYKCNRAKKRNKGEFITIVIPMAKMHTSEELKACEEAMEILFKNPLNIYGE